MLVKYILLIFIALITNCYANFFDCNNFDDDPVEWCECFLRKETKYYSRDGPYKYISTAKDIVYSACKNISYCIRCLCL